MEAFLREWKHEHDLGLLMPRLRPSFPSFHGSELAA